MPRVLTVIPYKEGKGKNVRWRVIVPKHKRDDPNKRQVRRFATKDAAEKFCATINGQSADMLSRFFQMSLASQSILLQSLELAGDAQTILDAVRFYREQKPSEPIHLKELVSRVVLAKEKSGKTRRYCNELKNCLTLFIGGKEDWMSHSIQPHHVENWVNSNATWSQFTKQTYLRNVTTMFTFAVKNGFCTTNPAAKVEKPSMMDSAPQILTVADCRRLMRAAEETDPALVQYLALCLFAGLRPTEAERLKKENILPDYIEVFAKKVRSRNRRLVKISPTIRAWLERYKDAKWKSRKTGKDYGPFELVNLRKRLMEVRKATAKDDLPEIRWPQDCLRHTFVSMHYALHGAATTAREAGHSESVLIQHYREIVTKEQAEEFWGIRPKDLC